MNDEQQHAVLWERWGKQVGTTDLARDALTGIDVPGLLVALDGYAETVEPDIKAAWVRKALTSLTAAITSLESVRDDLLRDFVEELDGSEREAARLGGMSATKVKRVVAGG